MHEHAISAHPRPHSLPAPYTYGSAGAKTAVGEEGRRGASNDAGNGNRRKGWIQDYTDGASFKMYSISLYDLPGDASLWGMSFRRQAK